MNKEFSDQVHGMIEKTYHPEEPCANTDDGDEKCYGSCSAETSREAMANAEKLILEIGSLPRHAYSGRDGSVHLDYITDRSYNDGKGHMIGGEQFLIRVGPGENETEESYQCLHWEQMTEAEKGRSKWQSRDRSEILERVRSVLSEWNI